MNQKQLSQWRTAIVTFVAMGCLTGGLAMAGHWPAAAASYPAFAGAIGVCVGFVAAKAYGQHRENARAEQPK